MQEKRETINFRDMGISDIPTLCFVNYTKSHLPLELHTHPCQFEICYHCTGTQVYILDGKEYRTNGGDLFVSFPNEIHSTGSYCEEKSTFYFMLFNLNQDTERFMDFNEAETKYLLQRLLNIKNRQFPANARIREILNNIFYEYKSDHPLRVIKIKALLTEFFCELIDCSDNRKELVQYDIQQVIDYMHQNPKSNCQLSRLAEISCLSLPRFKQKFKDIIGIPPMEYAVRLKIESAKKMLLSEQNTITEIAYDLGFSSSQHFSSVFKKYTTFTPKQFHKLK